MAVYLDYNATCPLDPEVIYAIQRSCVEDWGNPSSSYQSGQKAKLAVDKARQSVAQMIGSLNSIEITFVSGGTEVISIFISLICHKSCFKGNFVLYRQTIWQCIQQFKSFETPDRKTFLTS